MEKVWTKLVNIVEMIGIIMNQTDWNYLYGIVSFNIY